MKTIANRLIVFAASALALGTLAFGQNRLTADIPFAFQTPNGTWAAGTYQLTPQANSAAHAVVIRNMATNKVAIAGHAMLDYTASSSKPVLKFLCGQGVCALTAIRTSSGTLEYSVSHKSKNAEWAVVEVPLKTLATD